jgi:hypothetical protein
MRGETVPPLRIETSNRFACTAFLLAIMGLALASCGDDDGTSPGTSVPRETSVSLTVVDTEGKPVSGLEVGLANDVSANLHVEGSGPPTANKARVRFQLEMPVAAHLLMSVHDVEGDTVRVLVDEDRPAGLDVFLWNGARGAYPDWEYMPSGHYVLHVECRDPENGDLLFSDLAPMALFMMSTLRCSFGQTDDEGKITIAGRKLFPCFYQLDDQVQYDEAGEVLGTFNWKEEVFIALEDTASGQEWSCVQPIERGANEITVVWDPPVKPHDMAPADMSGPEQSAVKVNPLGAGPLPDEFRLEGPWPNPFN